MHHGSKFIGLCKIAQMVTVGDVINRINADMTLSYMQKRSLIDSINRSGLMVSQPANRLTSIGIGGALSGTISHYLGASPFWRGAATLGGMLYGNSTYNRNTSVNRLGSGVRRW